MLCAWLLAALTVLGAAPASADPPDQDDPQPAADPIDVQITTMTPAVLRPGDDWTIKGTVTNTGDADLADPMLRLRLQTYVPSSRSSLAAWNISGASYSPVVLRAHRLGKDLGPGQTKSFSFEIAAEDSPFSRFSEWGPRGIAVTATSGQVRDAQRTTALWYPEDDPIDTTTELTVIATLTPTGTEWSAAVDEGISVAQASAARLAPVVQQMKGTEITWALDPALLDAGPLGEAALSAVASTNTAPSGEPTGPSTDQTGNTTPPTSEQTSTEQTSTEQTSTEQTSTGENATPPADDTQDSGQQTPSGNSGADQGNDQPSGQGKQETPTGTELTEMIAQAAAGRDVVALAYGDADPAALALGETPLLFDAAAERAGELFAEHDIHPIEDMLWPARHDLQSLTTLAGRGIRSVILPGEAQEPVSPLTYSPSGRSRISTEAGELEAALWDSRLSAIFDSGHSPLQMRQALLAETAVIAREHPADARGFLATLPRDLGTDPGQVSAIVGALAAVEQAPWLELTNMRSLLGRSAPGIERQPLPATPMTEPVLDAAAVADLSKAWSSLTNFATITTQQDRFLAAVGSNILSAFSSTLATEAQTQQKLQSSVTDALEQLTSAIQVESGSTVNLISSSGEIPIAVHSSLQVPVTVTVRLVPEDPRLQPEGTATITLAPQSAATARIPVTAVSNGNVEVHGEVLTAPEGEVLASGEVFSVRVRADWESTGTIIIAALLIVGFVIGLVRTIRRGRRSQARRRAAAAKSGGSPPAAGPSIEEDT